MNFNLVEIKILKIFQKAGNIFSTYVRLDPLIPLWNKNIWSRMIYSDQTRDRIKCPIKNRTFQVSVVQKSKFSKIFKVWINKISQSIQLKSNLVQRALLARINFTFIGWLSPWIIHLENFSLEYAVFPGGERSLNELVRLHWHWWHRGVDEFILWTIWRFWWENFYVFVSCIT